MIFFIYIYRIGICDYLCFHNFFVAHTIISKSGTLYLWSDHQTSAAFPAFCCTGTAHALYHAGAGVSGSDGATLKLKLQTANRMRREVNAGLRKVK